jgi:predicted TIM-barrel fold metal-dependent hydrolase
MLSRRELLKLSAAGLGAAIVDKSFASVPSQPMTPADFAVPANATDSHTHMIGDPKRFPFVTPRGYTPDPASISESLEMHRKLHLERIVFVQISVYGADNSCMIDAMKKVGPNARGIAVLDDKTPSSELDRMYVAGVRGIRANVEDSNLFTPEAAWPVIQTAMDRIKNHPGCHVQIHTRMAVIEGLKDKLMNAPVPIVIDHYGEAKANLGPNQPGFPALLELVRKGKVYVKLSAPYHLSTDRPYFSDVAPLCKALTAANPHQILYGTDWPHTQNIQGPGRTYRDISPFAQIDDGIIFNQFAKWTPDPVVRKAILVENPARLFRY